MILPPSTAPPSDCTPLWWIPRALATDTPGPCNRASESPKWDLPPRHIVTWHHTILSQASLLKGGCPLSLSFAPLLFLSSRILHRSSTHRVSLSQNKYPAPVIDTADRVSGALNEWNWVTSTSDCKASTRARGGQERAQRRRCVEHVHICVYIYIYIRIIYIYIYIYIHTYT